MPSILQHKYVLIFAAYASLGSLLYGYDGTYFSGVVAMKTFINDFGTENAAGVREITPAALSLMTSLVYVGELIGSFVYPVICDKLRGGRKGAIAAAMLAVLAGASVQVAASGQQGVIIAGRIILGVGVGLVSNAVPQYLSEIAPKEIRGVVVGSWQFTLAFAQIIGACVCQGTKDISSTASYRIPMGLQMIIPVVVYALYAWIPESPRWLVSVGRTDKAGAALRTLHKEKLAHGYDEQEELSLLKQDKELDDLSKESSWRSLFGSPVERRKLFLAVGILAAQQLTGVQFFFSYFTVFLQKIGSVEHPFLWTIILDIFELIGVVGSFFLINRFGRRPLLIWTSVIMIVCLVVSGGLATAADEVLPRGRGIGIIVASLIYVLAFNLAFGPLAWVVASELTPGPNRARTFSLGTATFWIVAWAVTFTQPYLFTDANLGGRVAFVYAGGCLCSLAFVYFCIPETLGRSLEEISEMFDARLPLKEWPAWQSSRASSEVGKLERDSTSVDEESQQMPKNVAPTSGHLEQV
ncbi:general substrate transporter [Protomyces lactucae-debilis]|uniref:General substrate transporter n=1 Tax=Protomyces lactucae-debilis TaxID=2754530 RepID=A0A1Y2FBZ6_PROLT|nr:general substrate transporter [Protomyces lactucae-debilis]ORY81421.1 general substrate transporter [Protomyces lactucae-debilis]